MGTLSALNIDGKPGPQVQRLSEWHLRMDPIISWRRKPIKRKPKAEVPILLGERGGRARCFSGGLSSSLAGRTVG